MTGIDFTGRTVVITGSSRGIGLGIAQGFARAGATLHLIANDAAVHDRAADLGATAAEADISVKSEVLRALAPLERIDVLINNAGLELMTPIADASDATTDAFRRVIDINVTGTALVTATALGRMGAGGAIVNTASIWGRVAEPGFGAYVASKHGVVGLTRALALEFAAAGVRVNAICPTKVQTPMVMGPPPECVDYALLTRSAPWLNGGEPCEPPDIADAVAFLASDEARRITGIALPVDGGQTAN